METTVDRGWRKSSYSGNGGQCVEVAADGGSRVLVRDTTDQAGSMLRFSPNIWRRLLDQVKSDASLAFGSRLTRGTVLSSQGERFFYLNGRWHSAARVVRGPAVLDGSGLLVKARGAGWVLDAFISHE